MAVEPVLFSDWIVGEALRALRPGGVLVGYFCNRSSFRGLKYRVAPSARRWARTPGQYVYCYPLKYAPWKRALCAQGFEVVHEEGLSWPPFSNASDSPLIAFAARLERLLGLWRLTRFSPHILFVARKCA
jgi:hypothetical protein